MISWTVLKNSILIPSIWERALSQLKMYLNDQFCFLLICIQWWKMLKTLSLNHILQIFEWRGQMLQMRFKNVFKNSIYLTCKIQSKNFMECFVTSINWQNWRNWTKPILFECSSVRRSEICFFKLKLVF